MAAAEGPDAEPQLVVTDGGVGVVAREPGPGRVLAQWRLGEHGFALTADADGYVARYFGLCEARLDWVRSRMRVVADPSAPDGFAAVFVSGGLMAAWLALRGEVVLHASAVARDGTAVAFCAPMGGGKSTLAALACARGWRVVTDDALRADPDATCWAGPSELRLRANASAVAERFTDRAPTADQRIGVRTPPADGDRFAMRTVVLPLLDRDRDSVHTERLVGAGALSELTAHARTPGWRDPGIMRTQFGGLAALARAVPIVRARIPWADPPGPDALDGLLETVPADEPSRTAARPGS